VDASAKADDLSKLTLTLGGDYAAADRQTQQAWDGGFKAVTRLCQLAGVTGKWKLVPVRQTRWQGGGTVIPDPPVDVRGIPDGRSIRLRVKPGDNGSVWDYALVAYSDQRLRDVLEALEAVFAGDVSSASPPKAVAKPEPARPAPAAPKPEPPAPAKPAPPPPPQPSVEVTALGQLAALMSKVQAVQVRVEDRRKKRAQIAEAKARCAAEMEELKKELDGWEEDELRLLEEEENDVEAREVSSILVAFSHVLPPPKEGPGA
jgi:hypothetical protein